MNNDTDAKIDGQLKAIREDIDQVDDRILEFLSRRAELCRNVGEIKSHFRDSVFKPHREKEVMDRLVKKNPGVLPEDHLRAIYREILSSSRKLQQPQKVVYLGPEGTFSFFAGRSYLGHSADFQACTDLKEVFQAVAAREAQLGIIPFENSLHGSVGQSLDMFLDYDVYIHAEIFSKINHALLSQEDSVAQIRTVYSHPQALGQCASWLRVHLPNAALVPVESTAAAARRAAEEKQTAAVGHAGLGKMLGLNILSQRIEDLPDNWTRFMIIGPDLPTGGSREKTSLLFSLPDKPGSLANILNILAGKGININKLESRPMRSEKWKYVFFTDLECNLTDNEHSELKRLLTENCHKLRILGSYPAGPYLNDA